jgi:uncharacterized protein
MLCYIRLMISAMTENDTYDNDTYCAVSWRSRPGSFVSLMSWLVPRLHEVEGSLTSDVDGDCRLHLVLGERSRYTTTLSLTYLFEDSGVVVADPDLQVRVYHDARLAEAQSCARWHRHSALGAIRSQLARDLGDRWLRNVMLNKWLDYCVERGHRFQRTAR